MLGNVVVVVRLFVCDGWDGGNDDTETFGEELEQRKHAKGTFDKLGTYRTVIRFFKRYGTRRSLGLRWHFFKKEREKTAESRSMDARRRTRKEGTNAPPAPLPS